MLFHPSFHISLFHLCLQHSLRLGFHPVFGDNSHNFFFQSKGGFKSFHSILFIFIELDYFISLYFLGRL